MKFFSFEEEKHKVMLVENDAEITMRHTIPQANVTFCRIFVMKKRLKSKKADHGFFLCVKNLANSGFDSLFCLISIIYYKVVGFLCH